MVATVLQSSPVQSSPGLASPPSAIADAVVRVVGNPRPKTRYVVGRGAKPDIFARRLPSDRALDRR